MNEERRIEYLLDRPFGEKTPFNGCDRVVVGSSNIIEIPSPDGFERYGLQRLLPQSEIPEYCFKRGFSEGMAGLLTSKCISFEGSDGKFLFSASPQNEGLFIAESQKHPAIHLGDGVALIYLVNSGNPAAETVIEDVRFIEGLRFYD